MTERDLILAFDTRIEDDPVSAYRGARCGVCGGAMTDTLHLVALAHLAAWKHPTIGNVLTGEAGRACAVVCAGCIDGGRCEPNEAVELTEAGSIAYHPVSTLAEA